MPPAAIASSVVRVISSSPRRSRYSSTGAGGNLGERPKPPQTGSKTARRFSSARSSSSAASGSGDGRRRELERMCSTRFALESRTSSRLSRHASATASSTCRKAGRPWRGSGGKYVPPKNGSPAGVTNTVIGQPPWPVSATTASM